MQPTPFPSDLPEAAEFRRGAMVLATLNSPREKFWGVLLYLAGAGAVLRGISLESFDDFVRLMRAKEPTAVSTVFFPMHRLERLEADEPCGEAPSLAEQFAGKTGLSAATALLGAEVRL
jgi:hypothetical protein